jgi:Amt family ammonium transporter
MKRIAGYGCILTAFCLSAGQTAWAQTETASKLDTGDTAWVLASAALVLFMTPGLALFYGGMARQKNILSTIMHSYFIMGIVSVQWVLFGYSLAFGPDVGSVLGSLEHLGNPGQVAIQAVGVVATVVYSFVLTYILLRVVDATIGLRASEEEEMLGLDLSQHGERAYGL